MLATSHTARRRVPFAARLVRARHIGSLAATTEATPPSSTRAIARAIPTRPSPPRHRRSLGRASHHLSGDPVPTDELLRLTERQLCTTHCRGWTRRASGWFQDEHGGWRRCHRHVQRVCEQRDGRRGAQRQDRRLHHRVHRKSHRQLPGRRNVQQPRVHRVPLRRQRNTDPGVHAEPGNRSRFAHRSEDGLLSVARRA